MNNEETCACGACENCVRRARLAVAGYVAERRFAQRGSYNRSDPAERRYVHRQVRLLLAMTGLADEHIFGTDELRRSDWGRAMRVKQSSQ